MGVAPTGAKPFVVCQEVVHLAEFGWKLFSDAEAVFISDSGSRDR